MRGDQRTSVGLRRLPAVVGPVGRSAGRDGGQAMAEFAIVTAALLGGLAVMSFQILPDFIEALQIYLNGFYILLHLPIP
jgi:hypothetical protein